MPSKAKLTMIVIRNVFNSHEELQSGVYAFLVEYMTSNHLTFHHLLRQGPFDVAVQPAARLSDFIENYTTPAIEAGYVTMLYPETPKRKGQAYHLTPKGL